MSTSIERKKTEKTEKPEKILSLSQVSYAYSPERPLLRALSLDLVPGRMCAILGANGVGKSTLLRIMAGLLQPHSGEVALDAKPFAQWTPREVAQRVAWVAQEPSAFGSLSVRSFVALGRAPYTSWHGSLSVDDLHWIERALRWSKLTDFADRDIALLSGGERRRVQLARAYAQATRVILFDEPTAFLDPRQQWSVCESIVELVRERSVAAAIVLHDPSLALRYCDDVLLLGPDHKVWLGPAEEVLSDSALSEAFSVQTRLGRDAQSGLPYTVTLGDPGRSAAR